MLRSSHDACGCSTQTTSTINLKRSTLHPYEGQADRPNTPSEPAIGPVKTKTRNVTGLKSWRVVTFLSFLAVWIAAFNSSAAFGQDAETKEALRLITETANQICQAPPLEQHSNGLDLSGDAKAKVGGLAGKLADLGIEGAAKYHSGHSAGVLQKDLITAILSGNDCRQHVFDTLVGILLNSTPGVPDADKTGTTKKNAQDMRLQGQR